MEDKKYATKDDIIDLYKARRPILSRREVEDLVNCFFNYTKSKMLKQGTTDIAYHIYNFGQFYENKFDPRELVKATKDVKRIKAEKLMIEYITGSLVKPIKFNIQDDKVFRI